MKTQLLLLTTVFAVCFADACEDQNSFCPQYARFGYCTVDAENMKKTCPKSCGLCDDTGTGGGGKVPQGQCGLPVGQGSRIINGETAKKDAWPWQVSIYYQGQFLCGGSVLSPKWILTAAHCVDGFDYRYYQAVLGDYNRQTVDGDEQVYRARQALHHPDWMRPTKLNNDVALIELDRPVIFNRHVQPVCLPNTGEVVPVGKKCYITGWGQYTIGRAGPPTTILKQSPLDVVSQNECYNLNTPNLGIEVTKKMICAGLGPNVPNGGCHGDSGGPFVCQRDDGRWVLEGSVSWGSGYCDTSQAYSVFARINQFRSWIDSHVQ